MKESFFWALVIFNKGSHPVDESASKLNDGVSPFLEVLGGQADVVVGLDAELRGLLLTVVGRDCREAHHPPVGQRG